MRSFSLYIHWPFCQSRCPYCDFNAHVREKIDQDQWRRAFMAELEYSADMTQLRGAGLTSIFFGGGTPSLMAPQTVAALIDQAHRLFACSENLEITLEANPSSVQSDHFRHLSQAGVNRLSLGVQSFDDQVLEFLGRGHNSHMACQSLEVAFSHFKQVTFDLIYARPNQTLAQWKKELSGGLSWGANHMSLYQLTMEPGTVFHHLWKRGELVLPDEKNSLALYDMTQDMMGEKGLNLYEISNYARHGHGCRHNLNYWRYGEYMGIGPGAHGRVCYDSSLPHRTATRMHRAPEIWLSKVEEKGCGLTQEHSLSFEESFEEMMMMGLRLCEPIKLARCQLWSGQTWRQALDESRLDDLIAWGDLALDDHHQELSSTDQGRRRLNGVLDYLFARS